MPEGLAPSYATDRYLPITVDPDDRFFNIRWRDPGTGDQRSARFCLFGGDTWGEEGNRRWIVEGYGFYTQVPEGTNQMAIPIEIREWLFECLRHHHARGELNPDIDHIRRGYHVTIERGIPASQPRAIIRYADGNTWFNIGDRNNMSVREQAQISFSALQRMHNAHPHTQPAPNPYLWNAIADQIELLAFGSVAPRLEARTTSRSRSAGVYKDTPEHREEPA